MKNTAVLLAYRNKSGQLRTTYIAETPDSILSALDTNWTDKDKLDELGYHGALKTLGDGLDSAVYYDKVLNGRRIPEKQPSWAALVEAVTRGDYDADAELRHVIVFNGSRWVPYPCAKGDPFRADFENLARMNNPGGRYKVTLEVTLNALSPSDAKLDVLNMLRDALARSVIGGIARGDRNIRVNADARELSAPVY